MGGTLSDLIAVVRCGRLGLAVLTAVRSARPGAADAMATFGRVVVPIIDRTVKDEMTRARVRDALLSASVTLDYLVTNYTIMAGLPLHRKLSVLGASFARLYDDLVDEVDQPSLDDRLAELFHGGPFDPATDLEKLLQELYVAIDAALDRPRDDPVYAALYELHVYQHLSRLQTDPSITADALDKIARGKGGLASVVVFGLMRRGMCPSEWELLMELGEALQLLDDYLDLDFDLRGGIVTAVTRGDLGLAHVSRRLRSLRPRLFAFYGSAPARQFVAMLFTLLVAAFFKRRLPSILKRRWHSVRLRSAGTPMRLLMFRGQKVTLHGQRLPGG